MKFFTKFVIGFVLLMVLLSAAPAWPQSSSTGLVLGTVTDPDGNYVQIIQWGATPEAHRQTP